MEDKMKRIFTIIIFLIVIGMIFIVAPNYLIGDVYEKNEIRVILDDKEITKELPEKAIIKEGKIMLSRATVDKYFDKYLYLDEKYNTLITTSDKMVSKLTIGENKIQINNDIKDITVPAQLIDELIYIPIEELQEVYDIQVEFNEKVIITSNQKAKSKIYIGNNLKQYKLKTPISRVTGNINANEFFYYYGEDYKTKWIYVRNSRGDLGYIDTDKIYVTGSELKLPELDFSEIENKYKKINLVWEYAENFTPNRTGETKIEGLNVVSPTWFYLKNTNGDVTSKVDQSYISWAKGNEYSIWAAFKNDWVGIDGTSTVVTDMKIREKTINQVVNYAVENKIQGINIDFENMKEIDVNVFSQFVRELSALLRNKGIVVSIDVTVPDGSPTWSLCYDRKELNDAVDYLILMAYDQHGISSSNPGSVAALNWVETNINKMLNLGVDKEKLILGIPFYSRVWTSEGDKTTSYPIGMQDELNYLNMGNMGNKEWLADEGQYYLEFASGNKTVRLWAEEQESIAEKIKLIKEYNLAGVAAWRRGYEVYDIWKVINENL
jgi:spore germination protein YaaH